MDYELTKREYLDDLYRISMDLLESDVYLFAEHKCINMSNTAQFIEYSFETLAIIEMCYKNYIKAREYFYKATIYKEWFYSEFPNKNFKIDVNYVTTYAYESLYNAILSGNKERAVHMAELFGSYKELENNEFPANVLLGYSLKYVILNDKSNALEYINKLEKSKGKSGMKQLASGHGRAFRGIIESDEKEFNLGLEFMLKHHIARMKRHGNDLKQYFAYDSVALAMIAIDRGIHITVNHELLPMEYLSETSIDYSKFKMGEK